MLLQKFSVRLLLIFALLFANLLPVLAQIPEGVIPCANVGDCAGMEVDKLAKGDFWEVLIPQITKLMVYALGITSLIIFSAAGVMYVTAFGDQEQTKKATDMIIWGVVGLAFAAGAYALVSGVLGLKF